MLHSLASCSAVLCRYASFMLPYKRGELKQYADKAWQSVMKGFEAPKCPNKVTAVMMGQHSR